MWRSSDGRLAIFGDGTTPGDDSGLCWFGQVEERPDVVGVARLAHVVVEDAVLAVRVDHDVHRLREGHLVPADATLLRLHGVPFGGTRLIVLRGSRHTGALATPVAAAGESEGRKAGSAADPAVRPQFHFHPARVGFKADSAQRWSMAVQEYAPRDDATVERRIDVTGLPAGALRDFAETTDGDVFLERKRGTFVVTTD